MQPPGPPPPRRLRAVRQPVAPPAPWWASEVRTERPAPVGSARIGSGRSEQAARALFADLARDVVDHGLQRRAVLTAATQGRRSAWELCDAHPHLVTAARHHGVPTGRNCPICKRAGLSDVHFVYGESLKHVAGQAKSPAEVRRLAAGNGHAPRTFDVYVVEVCTHCRWNHLLRSFVVAASATDPAGDSVGYGRAASSG
ncbi:DUF5318 family protein [Jatrophihabitans sp. YIM 134969]